MKDKKREAYEHRILTTPRTDSELEEATDFQVPIHKYSDLVELSRKPGGARRMLAYMFKRAPKHIILLQDPSNMSSGHWISVSMNPRKKEIYFFSTYGKKPDVEKVQWMSDDELLESGQEINIFSDGLRELQKHGWEIHYNDKKYQHEGDDSATCGIFTVAFLNSGKNPEEFAKDVEFLEKRKINPAIEFFERYFK